MARKQQKRESREKASLRKQAEKEIEKDSTHSTLSGFATSVDRCSLVLDARALSQASHVEKKGVYLPEASIRTLAWQTVDDLALGSGRTPLGRRAYIRMWAEEESKADPVRVVPCRAGHCVVRPGRCCACCAFLGLDFC